MTRITKDEITGVMFDIVGSKDGWLLIQNGSDGGLTFDKAHEADGRGWISARLVGTALRMTEFRTAPRRDASLVARLNGENWSWGPWSVEVLAVHGCSGNYVEVTARPPAAGRCADGPSNHARSSSRRAAARAGRSNRGGKRMLKVWGRNTSSNVQKVMWAVTEIGCRSSASTSAGRSARTARRRISR
jgi:hypothetical protein